MIQFFFDCLLELFITERAAQETAVNQEAGSSRNLERLSFGHLCLDRVGFLAGIQALIEHFGIQLQCGGSLFELRNLEGFVLEELIVVFPILALRAGAQGRFGGLFRV